MFKTDSLLVAYLLDFTTTPVAYFLTRVHTASPLFNIPYHETF